MKLFKHQESYLIKVIDELNKGTSSLLCQSATGWGKTIAATFLSEHMRHRAGFSSLFFVHKREIFMQTVEKFLMKGSSPLKFCAGAQEESDAYGLIAGSGRMDLIASPENSNATLIAMIPTAIKRNGGDFQKLVEHFFPQNTKRIFVQIDEAHHAASRSWSAWFKKSQDAGAIIVGWTATPERLSGEPLSKKGGGLFDELMMGDPLLSLVERGILCPVRIICPPSHVKHEENLDESKAEKERREKKDAIKLIGDMIPSYEKYLGDAKMTLGFGVSISHCEMMAEEFNKAGIASQAVHGKMPSTDRKYIIESFKAGEIRHLLSCDLIGEGVDFPAVDGIQDARPTGSRTIFFQHIGRGMRMKAGKKETIILDHAGNTLDNSHGHPYVPVKWNFHGKVKKGGDEKATNLEELEEEEKIDKSIFCINPNCHTVNPPNTTHCISCGAILNPAAVDVDTNIDLVEHSWHNGKQNGYSQAMDEAWKVKNVDEIADIAKKYDMSEDWLENVIAMFKSMGDSHLFNWRNK